MTEEKGTKLHGIGWAVKQMWGEQNVMRPGWNGKGMWLAIRHPSRAAPMIPQEMSVPYIYMRTSQGDFIPWLASQADLLATDWMIFE
jgi:hypothetical protein